MNYALSGFAIATAAAALIVVWRLAEVVGAHAVWLSQQDDLFTGHLYAHEGLPRP